MYFSKKDIFICFFILFIGLLMVFYPSFHNAPRSDWWESLYFFHTIYSGDSSFVDIFNTDCFGHVTFRPLSHPVLYIQHKILGSNFFYMHIINFFLYSLSIVLLYVFFGFFVDNKKIIIFFLFLYAFLFSHFDIVSWTAHSYLILAFCLFLLGFIFYARFLSSGKVYNLFIVGVCFLTAMLMYEAFALWPLAVFIMSFMKRFKRDNISKRKILYSCIIFLVCLYLLLIAIFFLTRAIGTYQDSWIQTKNLVSELCSLKRIMTTIFALSFNILYNNILVNVFPNLSLPVWIDPVSSNPKMNYFFRNTRPTVLIMFFAFMILVLIIIGLCFVKRKEKSFLSSFILMLYLLLSFTFLLYHFKYFSNKEYLYNFQQFRYQYIPNAFIVGIVMLILDRSKKVICNKIMVAVLILLSLFIFSNNLKNTVAAIALEKEEMCPLNTMLNQINLAIKDGIITPKKKLYIDDDIALKLPNMCWNKEMGNQFIKGTYEWFFSADDIDCFTRSIDEAYWIIDKNFLVVKKHKFNNAI